MVNVHAEQRRSSDYFRFDKAQVTHRPPASAGPRPGESGRSEMPSIADATDTIGALAGAANVIMQLSWPAIGWGVRESTQDGNVYYHPMRRARTTFQYLAVATTGSDEDKRKYRREVTRIHSRVCSGAGSPVEYDALDPELQLWVAACLYIGYEDAFEWLYGKMTDDEREHFYQSAHVLGTTLQVSREQWPESRDAFDDYWYEGAKQIRFDPQVREHLLGIAALRMLPQPATMLFGKVFSWITFGFLHAEFRDALDVPWTPKDQRRFNATLKALAALNRTLPMPIRQIANRVLLVDLRLRVKLGKSLM